MKTVTVQEAAKQFDEYAQLAHRGERVLVTQQGRPWVVLGPVEPAGAKASDRAGLQWPDFAARLAPFYAQPVTGPTATELLAQDKEDRF